MTYPVGYPLIVDWPEYVRVQLPDVAAEGGGAAFAAAIFRPLAEIDSRVAGLYAGLVAIGDATGGTLDLLGDRLGEPRGGLSNGEYRRIIAGRRVARFVAITAPRVLAGWRAVTGAAGADAWIVQPGSSSIQLFARVTATPSGTYLVRAARVVRDLCDASADVSATIYKSSSSIYGDAGTGYGVGAYAWSLPTMEG